MKADGGSSDKMLSILGCGWLGRQAATYFSERGFYVKASAASSLSKLENLPVTAYLLRLPDLLPEAGDFFNTDYLLLAFPPGRDGGSYVEKMAGLRGVDNPRLKGVIFISSTAVYEEGEITHSHTNFSLDKSARAEKILAAEEELNRIFGKKLTVLRCGGLIGENRHPGKFLAGKTGLEKGKAPVNLISGQDVVRAIEAVINKEKWGKIYPLVHPHHPKKEAFYTRLTQQLGLALPQFSGYAGGKYIDADFTWKELNILPTFPSLYEGLTSN